MQAMARLNSLSALLVVPFLVLVWQEDSCRGSKMNKPVEEKVQRVVEGTWGGQHIILEVTGAGASVVMDCAHGTINKPIEIDAAGHFEVPGTFVTETPGPVRQGDERGQPARYVGTVKADAMSLTIASSNSGEKLGSFTLNHGKAGRIRKCL